MQIELKSITYGRMNNNDDKETDRKYESNLDDIPENLSDDGYNEIFIICVNKNY